MTFTKIVGAIIVGVIVVTFVPFNVMDHILGTFSATKLHKDEFINKNIRIENIDSIKVSKDLSLGYFSRLILNKDTINYLIRGIKNAQWSTKVGHPSVTGSIDLEIFFKTDTSAFISIFNLESAGTNLSFRGFRGLYRNDTLKPIIKALSDELYKDTAIYSKRHRSKKYLNY